MNGPVVPLRRMFDSVTGGSWGTDPEEGEHVLRCIRGTDFLYSSLRIDIEGAPLRGYTKTEVAKRVARRGDLIVEKSGGGEQQPVGRVVLHDNDEAVMPTNFAGRLRPTPQVDPRFVCYLLAGLYSDGRTRAVIKQTTGIQNLDLGALLGLHVRCPPLPEQRAIADYLDAETARIDALIEKKRQMLSLLEERFEALVFYAVTSGLRGGRPMKPSGLRWVDQIPFEWGTPPVSANFDLQLGKMLNADAAAGPKQFPYLRNVNVQWDRIDLADVATMHFSPEEQRRCSLEPGDLLVCEGGEVGRAAVWHGELTPCFYQKAIHRLRPRGHAQARFLMYALRAAAKLAAFAVEGNTSTIVHLTGEQLAVYRFPWPSDDEQSEIVMELDEAARATASSRMAVERQVALLMERRQAVISVSVQGDERVAA